MSKLPFNSTASLLMDERRSSKLYKKALKAHIDSEITRAVANSIEASILLDIRESEDLLVRLSLELPDSLCKLPMGMREDIVRLDGHKSKDEQEFSGEERGLAYRVTHLEERVYSLKTLLSEAVNAKSFYYRFKAAASTLYSVRTESRDGKIMLNKVMNRLYDNLFGDTFIYDGVGVDISSNPNHIKQVMTMNALISFASTSFMEMTSVTSDTGAKTFLITTAIPDNADVSQAWYNVRKRAVKYSQPSELVGSKHHLVSGNSWKYEQPEFTPEVLNTLNIMRSTPLSIRDDATAEEIEAALMGKLDVESFANLKPNEMWKLEARDKALDELEDIVRNGNKFYVTHFLDRVGRVYEESEYWAVQQNSEMRSLIEFHDKKKLDEAGISAMKLDIACKMGYDKATKAGALKAFILNQAEWRKNPAVAREFKILDNADKETGFIVYQDATNSGTQMYAIASRSVTLAKISGLIPGDREDAYQLLCDGLNERLGTQLFIRSNTKSLFMTYLYGAGKELLTWGKRDKRALYPVATKNGKMYPLMLTLQGTGMDPDDVWDVFTQLMMEIAPEAVKFMKYITSLVDDTTGVYKWTAPDGLVCQTAMYDSRETVIYWGDNSGHQHRVTIHEKFLVPGAKAAALAPGLIQSMDAFVLREVVRRAKEMGIRVVTVHDSFGSHPNDAAAVREIYAGIMADLLDNNFLSYAMAEAQPGVAPINAQYEGTLTREDVLNSEYALWA